MKILFLCGCLEPGRDGVGDYTRRLGKELTRLGFKIFIISLYDKYSNEGYINNQFDYESEFGIFRIPDSWSFKKRLRYVNITIDDFNPYWISLQYVGFGFNKHGLPLELLSLIKVIKRKKKFHVMFHELWCGMGAKTRIKERLLGALQKVFIKNFISKLQPEKVFTNIDTYSKLLFEIGIKAETIPVFSNIPFYDDLEPNEQDKIILNLDLLTLKDHKKSRIVIGFFGTIYRMKGIEEILIAAKKAARLLEKELNVLSVGHNNGINIEELVKPLSEGTFWSTGSLSPSTINYIMKFVDLGIVTTPADGINKSGTAMAWIERGIPVLISSLDNTYCSGMPDRGIYQINDFNDVLLALKNKLSQQQNRLEEAVNSYKDLFNHNN